MSIFQVEQYLEEAIDSVLNQSIGFQENIQLILINDGSTDRCEKICIKYLKQHPLNVVYKFKQNGGLASAKNKGLSYRQGKYVSFFDPDDTLGFKTLELVYDFFEKHRNCIDFVTIPIYFFEARQGLHEKYKYLGKRSRLIDLSKEPHNFVLSTAASFYKTECFKTSIFDERMSIGEDAKFSIALYEKNSVFGFVFSPDAHYNYRQRACGGGLIDNSSKSTNQAILLADMLIEATKDSKEDMPLYLKEIIIYIIRSRYKLLFELSPDIEGYQEAYRKLETLRNSLDRKFLATRSKWLDSQALKVYFASNFMMEPLHVSPQGKIMVGQYTLFTIGKTCIKIKSFHFQENEMILTAFVSDYNLDEIDLILTDCNNKETPKTRRRITSKDNPFNIKFSPSKIISNPMIYEFRIPFKVSTYSFYFKIETVFKLEREIVLDQQIPFALKDNYVGAFRENKKITFSGNQIKIQDFNPCFLSYKIKSICEIYKRFNFFAWERFFSMQKKKYILIVDDATSLRGNGLALAQHIKNNEPKLAKRTYLITNKKETSSKELKKIGSFALIGSLKHKFLYLNAKTIFSSSLQTTLFDSFETQNSKFYADQLNYKFIWLPDEAIANDKSKQVNRYKPLVDRIVVSSKNETATLLNDKYFFTKNEILETGCPAFDYLIDENKKLIAYFLAPEKPTTRINTETPPVDAQENNFNFDLLSSSTNLLQNENLQRSLSEHGYTLQVIITPQMAQYYKHFKQYENSCISIKKVDTIHQRRRIISEARMLITNHSDVEVEFSYLNKPIFYYQPNGQNADERENEALAASINSYLSNELNFPAKYLSENTIEFFYKDNSCCKRLIASLKANGMI